MAAELLAAAPPAWPPGWKPVAAASALEPLARADASATRPGAAPALKIGADLPAGLLAAAAPPPDWTAAAAAPARKPYTRAAAATPAFLPACGAPGLPHLPFSGARPLAAPSGPASAAPGPRAEEPMNVSLFLGAGMSAAYGMPTSSQFKERMMRRCRQRPAWRRLLEDPDLDIEDVWAALDGLDAPASVPGGGRWIRRLADAGIEPRSLAGLRAALESELFGACRWDPCNDSLLDDVLGPVLSIASGAGGRIRVFTTNYDKSVEEYCSDPARGFRCYDGFKHDPQTGRNLWSGFAGRPDPLVAVRGAATAAVLDLYHIHGSLRWKISRHGPERTAHEAKSADPGYKDALVYHSGAPKSAYEGIHGDVFRGFAEGLSASGACVAIGYSFRDRLIAEQFARFVKGGKTLVAVGPDAAECLENVLRLAEGRRAGTARWRRAGADRLVCSGGGRGTVHAIQSEIRPETVFDTVAAAKAAVAASAGLAIAPARRRARKRGGAVAPGPRGRPARAGRRRQPAPRAAARSRPPAGAGSGS